MNEIENYNIQTPHGTRVCGHNDTRMGLTFANGVRTGVCNVCNQTHILVPKV